MAGILYLCATPIGNLEDMTPRAQRMLAEADIIAAEDTRHTLQLLNRFNIKGRLVRYDEHSKERQGAYLLDELLSGKNIALVSDAGFPGIADPGEQLARLAIDAGVQVVPVPGANAALCAHPICANMELMKRSCFCNASVSEQLGPESFSLMVE